MPIEDTLLGLLKELTGAQESIEKVSVWVQQYQNEAPTIAQTWKTYYSVVSQEKKLTLLFLVNDVLQHTRKKGTQFVDAFGHILPRCLADCRMSESKSQVERMLDIWESRELFHRNIITAMKYNLDEVGMETGTIKVKDVVEVLDDIQSQEKQANDVLARLSHRLETSDIENAFNSTSRKEGNKYAADIDETALFLDQYCDSLAKQRDRQTDLVKKMNNMLFNLEKIEESVKTSDKDFKNQQTNLVRTRKAITARMLQMNEGVVSYGDDSPNREEIENLTSEEEEVDIEGFEGTGGNEVSSREAGGVRNSAKTGEYDLYLDDDIRPEDAIDEQLPNIPRERQKKPTKRLPSYEPRQVLSYGFRLDGPPKEEQAVGFLLLPDGTLAPIPIAPHMFLQKPKTPEELKIEENEPEAVEKNGPHTPEPELEDGEVIEKEEAVNEKPFNILEDGYATDEAKGSGSESPRSPRQPPSPGIQVSDEDPDTVATRNVSKWQVDDLDGEAFEDEEDVDTKTTSGAMTGLAAFLNNFSDENEDENNIPKPPPPQHPGFIIDDSEKPAFLSRPSLERPPFAEDGTKPSDIYDPEEADREDDEAEEGQLDDDEGEILDDVDGYEVHDEYEEGEPYEEEQPFEEEYYPDERPTYPVKRVYRRPPYPERRVPQDDGYRGHYDRHLSDEGYPPYGAPPPPRDFPARRPHPRPRYPEEYPPPEFHHPPRERYPPRYNDGYHQPRAPAPHYKHQVHSYHEPEPRRPFGSDRPPFEDPERPPFDEDGRPAENHFLWQGPRFAQIGILGNGGIIELLEVLCLYQWAFSLAFVATLHQIRARLKLGGLDFKVKSVYPSLYPSNEPILVYMMNNGRVRPSSAPSGQRPPVQHVGGRPVYFRETTNVPVQHYRSSTNTPAATPATYGVPQTSGRPTDPRSVNFRPALSEPPPHQQPPPSQYYPPMSVIHQATMPKPSRTPQHLMAQSPHKGKPGYVQPIPQAYPPPVAAPQRYSELNPTETAVFAPAVQQYSSVPSAHPQHQHHSRSRKRSRTNSMDRSGSLPPIEFSDLPPAKVSSYKMMSEEPPQRRKEPPQGMNAPNFKPFDFAELEDQLRFKPIAETSVVKAANASIFKFLQATNVNTTIDKVLEGYDMETDRDSDDEGRSILQRVFGGESRLPPSYSDGNSPPHQASVPQKKKLTKKKGEEKAPAAAYGPPAPPPGRAIPHFNQVVPPPAAVLPGPPTPQFPQKGGPGFSPKIPHFSQVHTFPQARPIHHSPAPTAPVKPAIPHFSQVMPSAAVPIGSKSTPDPKKEADIKHNILAKIAELKKQNEKEKEDWKSMKDKVSGEQACRVLSNHKQKLAAKKSNPSGYPHADVPDVYPPGSATPVIPIAEPIASGIPAQAMPLVLEKANAMMANMPAYPVRPPMYPPVPPPYHQSFAHGGGHQPYFNHGPRQPFHPHQPMMNLRAPFNQGGMPPIQAGQPAQVRPYPTSTMPYIPPPKNQPVISAAPTVVTNSAGKSHSLVLNSGANSRAVVVGKIPGKNTKKAVPKKDPVPIDKKKLEKAASIIKKIENDMNSSPKLFRTKSRFDVPPKDVQTQKSAVKELAARINDQVSKLSKGQCIASTTTDKSLESKNDMAPSPRAREPSEKQTVDDGVDALGEQLDYDDIDNLVDHKTADLELDLDF